MYRILAESQQLRERRDQLRHPHYQAPELIAEKGNEVWSWDITKLLGPTKWTYFYFYVILDIFSRYVVGWMLAYRESAELAKKLIEQTIEREQVEPGTLTLHADRGASMTSKPVAYLLAGLGVTKTHSRPHVSNDNPYSESQFKTMKYRPEFPERFGSYQDAHRFCTEFFRWYNHEHHHLVWDTSPLTRCTVSWRRNGGNNGARCSSKPSRETLSVLCVACQSQHCCQLRRGSTSPKKYLEPTMPWQRIRSQRGSTRKTTSIQAH
jgi:transposase InsO family protein